METVILQGVEITTKDYVDAQHPDGYFTLDELEQGVVVPPPGFDFMSPTDLTMVGIMERLKIFKGNPESNGLNIELLGMRMIAPVVTMLPGTIVEYACKARLRFYAYQIRKTAQCSFIYYRDNVTDNKKYRLRFVKQGTHAAKLNIGGKPSKPVDENLQIYMGWLPEVIDENIGPAALIIDPGVHMQFTFGDEYNGYSVIRLLEDNPTMLSMIDTENKVYMYYRNNVPAVMTEYVDSAKTYIIEIG
jgi:hypothetical protein